MLGVPLMSEILFENKNATVKKVSKETENGAKEYVYLDLLDENAFASDSFLANSLAAFSGF